MPIPDWPHHHRPTATPEAPALLLLHGTGGTEHDLVGLADRVAPGAALLSPRGRVNEGGAARFFPRLAEGVFDPAAVVPRIDELAVFVREATRHYKLDTKGRGLVALGFSNGANAAALLLQRHPDLPLAGALLLRPMVVLADAPPPGSLAGRRVLLLNGAQDPLVPLDHPPRLAALLQAGGAETTSIIHPEAGHGLVSADLLAARDFLAAR
jgi:predicted esterase